MEPAEYDTLRAVEDRLWWYRELRELVAEQVAQRLGAPGGVRPRILDAGCGTGGMLERLRAERPDALCVGVDGSPLALRHARERALPALVRGSVERLPLCAESFDLVVSLDVLYHRGVGSDLDALRELARCLRPGGTLLLNLPAFEALRSSHDAAIHTARRYRREPLRRLLAEAGLEPLRVSYRNTLLFPALALLRWLRKPRASAAEPGPSDLRPLPAALDRALAALLAAERVWLRARDLPFGLSLFAIAQRPQRGALPDPAPLRHNIR